MAIVFPRAMPQKGASGQEFEPQRVDFSSPEAGGRLGGVQAGFPLWLAVWSLGKMGVDASDAWRAWLLTMRGSQKRFLGRDMARPFPKQHLTGFAGMIRAGGGAFDGEVTGWFQSIDDEGNALLTLEGLPVGLVLSIGDYVGFRWDAEGADAATFGRRALVRVVEASVSDSGGDITVGVEPPVPGVVPFTAEAHLDEPACIMGIVTGETQLAAIDRRLAIGGGKIVGLQDLRP